MNSDSLLSQKRQNRTFQYQKTQQRVISRHPRKLVSPIKTIDSQRPSHNSPLSTDNSYRTLRYFFAILLIITAIGTSYFFLFKFATIQNINCQVITTQSPCDEALSAELQTVKNKPIFFTSIESITEHVSNTHPMYQDFSVKKSPPHTITVSVHLSPTLYMLRSPQSQVATVNVSGAVLEQSTISSQELPIIETSSDFFNEVITSHTLSDQQHQQFQELILQLKKSTLQYKKITWIDTTDITITLNDDKQLVLKLSGVESQLDLAMKILPMPVTEKPWQVLDMRFEKPILR